MASVLCGVPIYFPASLAPTHGEMARLRWPAWLVKFQDGGSNLWMPLITVLTWPDQDQDQQLSLSQTTTSWISYKSTSLWSAVKFLRCIFCAFCLAPLGMPLGGYCKAARFFITCCLRSGGSPSTTITGVMFSWRRLDTLKNRFLQQQKRQAV